MFGLSKHKIKEGVSSWVSAKHQVQLQRCGTGAAHTRGGSQHVPLDRITPPMQAASRGTRSAWKHLQASAGVLCPWQGDEPSLNSSPAIPHVGKSARFSSKLRLHALVGASSYELPLRILLCNDRLSIGSSSKFTELADEQKIHARGHSLLFKDRDRSQVSSHEETVSY